MIRKNTVVKKIFFLLLTIFIASKSESQTGFSKPPFGEGIITIGQFNFSPDTFVPAASVDITWQQSFYKFTYFIKGDKILRKDKPDSIQQKKINDTLNNDGLIRTTTIKLNPAHPVYLIDWASRMTYAFFTKKGKEEISAKPLKDETMEWFYRLSDSNRVVIKSLENTTSILIAEKKCFRGIGILKNGDSTSFYYTDEPLKVQSPLNHYFPLDFQYNVLCIKLPVDWTTADGIRKGTIILQVVEINEAKINDTLFTLPENVHIRNNVPWQEIFSPE